MLKEPLYMMPPFFCSQWKIYKEGEGTTWNRFASNENVNSFVATPGSVIEYVHNFAFYLHSRDKVTGDIHEGCYQFEGGERLILVKRHFIPYYYPISIMETREREYGWLLMLESYLLNDLEFYDAIYE